MKWLRFALALMLAAGAAAPGDVAADRGRSIRHHGHHAPRLGIHIGVPLYWSWPWPYYGHAAPYPPYYAYPPYYGYPPIVREPVAPPVYIEREDRRDEDAAAQGYWYYCDSPEGYYPYVRECPGGWERVPPRPAR